MCTDDYAAAIPPHTANPVQAADGIFQIPPYADALHALKTCGLYDAQKPLQLHLGCGETRLEGYINIDFSPAACKTMTPAADIYSDIRTLRMPDASVDAIRLHHVFEHFPRSQALALLIRWHRWLRVGGTLHIETPDFVGSAHAILSSGVPYEQKTAAIRHLVGDQAAPWAFHVDQWYADRFWVTLSQLGFHDINIETSLWNRPPFLANVTAIAKKEKDIPLSTLLDAADTLLAHSMVNESEEALFTIWKQQMRNFLYESSAVSPQAPCNG